VVEEDLYLTSDAHFAAKESRSFSHFFELDEIEASSFNLEKGKYRESRVKDFKTKDRLDQSFRDDSKSINFYLINWQKDLEVALSILLILRIQGSYLQFILPKVFPLYQKKRYSKFNKDAELKLIELNCEDFKVNFSKEVKKEVNV